MIEFRPVDLRKWSIFRTLDDEILQSIELFHVFGHETESAFFITSNDEVFAIGQNIFGRLGIGNKESTREPIRLDILCRKSIIYFATASIHTLALSKTGEVFAWGSNSFGQIGNGKLENQQEPCRVTFPEGVKIKDIATADRYCLALTEDNTLYHWGDIYWDSASQQPFPIQLKWSFELTIASIYCGGFHAVALSDNGKVLAWGVNEACQLGIPGVEFIQEEPVIVGGQIEDQFIVKVACSSVSTFALTEEGDLYAWGRNHGSSLPLGYPVDTVPFPQRVIFRKNFKDIASNNLNPVICAEAEDPHEVYLWFDEGNDYSAQLLKCSSLLEGFGGRAMPIVVRKFAAESPNLIHQSYLSPIQGPVRDIGKALFNKSELSDLTILLADGEVYVHSLIMKTFSEHFKTLLAENWSNGKTVINMAQYNSNAYRAFLKFVYTGLLEPLEGTEIIALCDIAVSYFENDLKNLCIQMFRNCLSSQNVVQLYNLAVGNHSELVDSCVQFTSQNMDAVILSDGFETLDPVLSKSLILNAVKFKYNYIS